jgi:dTDP-3-amino-3,4,6-trideoxy-alpha-D-glucose transaminase
VNQRRVPFLSLVSGDDADAIRAAIERVLARGWFILGPEVEAFEAEFAAASGARYAVGVGSGTDAIALALRAAGVGAGDEVVTTALSAAYTALAILMTGARPVFADIDAERMTIDPAEIESAITPRTRAIVPVHLYGQPAAMGKIEAIASRHGLAIVEDCCQAHLATENGRPVGTIGIAGAFSFYPTKNLGALGDGGAIITNHRDLASRLKRLRNGGQTDRYRHAEFGVNSRLDEMQAAVLRARLPRLDGWTDRRRTLASQYRLALAESGVTVPREVDRGHVYHLFVVRSAARNELQAHLAAHGVETLIHYPLPITRQPAFAATAPADCPVASRVCGEALSLPLHPRLSDADVALVATVLKGHDACVH